jgi:hypothetical protein
MSTNVLSGEPNKVVVHYKNGGVIKGTTLDFVAEKPKFHLTHADLRIEEIDTETMKAVFFVKTFEGNKDYKEPRDFTGVKPADLRGLKVKVTFQDNENVLGSTMGYNKQRKGFFILPLDPQSNNIRIYVVASAIKEIKLGSNADK